MVFWYETIFPAMWHFSCLFTHTSAFILAQVTGPDTRHHMQEILLWDVVGVCSERVKANATERVTANATE